MELNFRQGIARYQSDVLNNPIFLQKSAGTGDFIDLIVSPDPTIIVFAHKTANYIAEELKTVTNAWGPFTTSATVYLYWDMNLLTAEITRGVTRHPPLFTGTPIANPPVDQHWFDTTDTVMRVWNGSKWVEKIRVFAAVLSSGSIIRPYPLGSQAGIVGSFEGGSIVLDTYNKPLRQSDGTFVTSSTSLSIVNTSTNTVKFETEVMQGMAAEPIPKFSLIQMRAGKRIVLARSKDYMSRIAGIVLEDLYENEVGNIVSEGLVQNDGWSFPKDKVNRPVFCGTNGEVTLVPPTEGVLQIAGYVHDTDSVYFKHQQVIILDDITATIAPPPPPPPLAPVSDFFTPNTTGPAPHTVTFTSLSTNSPTGYAWDATNDGVIEGSLSTFTYTYSTPGVYNVRLRASNGFGHDDEIKVGYITVTQPAPSGLFTNLGIALGGPPQVRRNLSFQVSVNITNDGFATATNVVRTIVIADVGSHAVQPSGLPPSAVVTRDTNRTIITFAPVSTLPSGLAYGPVFFNLTAPPVSGKLVMYGSVESPEVDQTVGDNTASISIEVLP